MRRPCCEKQGINKGAWSKQEDQKLIDYIHNHGEGCWRTLPKAAGLLRCGKSCRLRWINYLRPDLKRGNFSEDEEDLIIKLHALLGNRWSLIAGRLPGRTDNEIKNYWNSHLRRKLLKMGVDPNNHRLSHTHLRPNRNVEPQTLGNYPLSSTVKTEASNALKPRNKCDIGEVSNAPTCLEEDDQPTVQPDLNLDLTITISYSIHDVANNINVEMLEEKELCDNREFGEDKSEALGSSPTLQLFS